MMKVGITGQSGFLGYHLYQNLALRDDIELIDFKRDFFDSMGALQEFVGSCDVIVHLAGLNRHNDPDTIMEVNTGLAKKLTQACDLAGCSPHIIYSSSTQETRDNVYGRSKKKAEEIFMSWAEKGNTGFSSFVIPNIFGPFGKPQYNSFIATFCHKLTHGETPEVHQDAEVELIYVQDLVEEITESVLGKSNEIQKISVAPRYRKKVTEVLELLNDFKDSYLGSNEIPNLEDDFEKKLFLTFRTFIPASHYPAKFVQHTDPRGSFTEIVRANGSGQTSFSTTVPGITRGNHFHTRKFERFAVIKGEALIQLRKIGCNEVINYKLSGEEPAYVDMPVWYTHNIINTGKNELLTLFWINEPFNADDPDTYFEPVENK